MPSENAIRIDRARLGFVLALSLALSFIGTSMAPGRVAAAPPDADPTAIGERAEAVIEAARRYIGVPYRLGTEGPGLFDCSGLVFRAFADAGELSQIGGARRTAASYRNWFASRGMFTLGEAELKPGDLVMYGGGEHIGIYLGDRQVLSALLTGVAVHPLDGISWQVTGFLKVDWSGKRKKSPPQLATDGGSGTVVDGTLAEAPVLPEEPANLGLPTYNTFERFQLGADTLAVNVATGNLVLSHPITTLPVGVDGALQVDLTYNSQSAVDRGLSPGWRLSAGRQLTEHENGDVTFTAGDGSWHTFTVRRTRGSITKYSRPVTVYATLRRDTSQTPEWTLTYRDGSVDYFATRDSEAALARSVDHLGNAIDYSYDPESHLLQRATDATGRHVDFHWDESAPVARLVKITEWAPLDDTEEEASETAVTDKHRFVYDADGYLAGWGDPQESRGRCPQVTATWTCLGYADGRLVTVSNRLADAGTEPTPEDSASSDVVTTSVAYAEGTAVAAQVSAYEYSEAGATGLVEAVFKRAKPRLVRVVRSGTSPVTTEYRLVSVADPLGRVRRIARDSGEGMTVEQRTVWDGEQPTEPAEVTTPLGTVSYHYVADSMGLVSQRVEQLSGSNGPTTIHEPAHRRPQ